MPIDAWHFVGRPGLSGDALIARQLSRAPSAGLLGPFADVELNGLQRSLHEEGSQAAKVGTQYTTSSLLANEAHSPCVCVSMLLPCRNPRGQRRPPTSSMCRYHNPTSRMRVKEGKAQLAVR